jgi:hypothetical protein
MAAKWQKDSATANRDDFDRKLTAAGHKMTWHLAPGSHRKGHCYTWVGDCEHCAANMTVSWCGSSCQGVRDARHVECSGPGTAVLTEIEQQHADELMGEALAEFATAVRTARHQATAPLN